MPELEDCLASFKDAFPKDVVEEVIVVDRHSSDETSKTAEKHGAKIVYDTAGLGSARLRGCAEAKCDWICFIDSDIILPKGWFQDIMIFLNLISKNCGMLFGVTIDTNKKLRRLREWRDKGISKLLKKGERGWTNNTLVRKSLVLSAPIKDINAWEDWVITQNVLNHGYKVLQVPIRVLHTHTTDKWGIVKPGWNASGMMQVVGLNFYTFKYINYYLAEGIRATIGLKDLYYMKWGVLSWLDVWRGILNLKSFVR